MRKFYVITDNNQLFIYICDNNKYVQQYINGEPCVKYSKNDMRKKIEYIKEYLVDEYNEDSLDDLMFIIISDANETLTENLMLAFLGFDLLDEAGLNEYKKENIISVNNLIKKVMKKYENDKSKMIDEFGVNFCGRHYFYSQDKRLTRASDKAPFSLTAYTLSKKEILECI